MDKLINDYKTLKIEKVLNLNKDGLRIFLTNINNKCYVIKECEMKRYDDIKRQFEMIKSLSLDEKHFSIPIEMGIIDDNTFFIALSYIKGNTLYDDLINKSDKEAYDYGVKLGGLLKDLHSNNVVSNERWFNIMNESFVKKVKYARESKKEIKYLNRLIDIYLNNIHLIKERPLTHIHGDFHLNNIILGDNLVVIDFQKMIIADPYFEFKSLHWNALRSHYLATGIINGYFDNEIPDVFFEILRLYTIELLITYLPWAYSSDETKRGGEVFYEMVRSYYDDFNLVIPKWYKGVNLYE